MTERTSLAAMLLRAGRALAPLPCPGCGALDRETLVGRDRYLLRIDVSRCRRCGLVHTARSLTGDAEAEFYRSTYNHLMRGPGGSLREQLDDGRLHAAWRMLRIAETVGPFRNVLEVGSGLGLFLQECRCAGKQVYGIEPGLDRAGFAQRQLGLGDAVTTEPLGVATRPPFTPDLIVLFHVLEHLERPAEALRLLAQWIDRDGWLVVEVPDLSGDWSSMGVANFHVSHRSYFTPATLCALLQDCGFEPAFVSREGGAAIYPGNLRVFARPRGTIPAAPLVADDPQRVRAHLRRLLRPWSLRTGYPRAAARLLRRLLR